MKTIDIQAKHFFDLLKSHEQSMWTIFEQMVNGEEQLIRFLDENDEVLFVYVLPKTAEELNDKRQEFVEQFKLKIQEKFN